jgi:acyl-CoA reductase-like NAD-dependent aldehyde dehydrogenase
VHIVKADNQSQAGLPAGVVNFVSMSMESTPTLTPEIIAHPAVRKIAVRIFGSSLDDLADLDMNYRQVHRI